MMRDLIQRLTEAAAEAPMQGLTVEWVDGVERWWKGWAKGARATFAPLEKGSPTRPATPAQLSAAIRAYADGRGALARLRDNLLYIQGLYPLAMTGDKKADIGPKHAPEQGPKLRITLPSDAEPGKFERYMVPNFPARVAYLIDDAMEVLRYGEKYERWAREPAIDRVLAQGDWAAVETGAEEKRVEELRPHLTAAKLGRIGLLDLKRLATAMASLFKYLRGAAENLAPGVRAATAAGRVQTGFAQGLPEAKLGNLTVVLNADWMDASMQGALAQKLARDPSEFHAYVKWARQAQAIVERAGLTHLWYGRIEVLPDAAQLLGGKKSADAAASYTAAGQGDKDYIRLFDMPGRSMLRNILHELGHRYWHHYLPRGQRAQWASRHGEVPTTAYGSTKDTEAFAEAFADYLLDTLRGDARQRFVSAALAPGERPYKVRVEAVAPPAGLRALLDHLTEAPR